MTMHDRRPPGGCCGSGGGIARRPHPRRAPARRTWLLCVAPSPRWLALALLCLAGDAVADAALGEFAGYRLGARFRGEAADRQPQPDGSVRVVPVETAPGDRQSVHLYVTPTSSIVGKVVRVEWFSDSSAAEAAAEAAAESLRAEYPDWTARIDEPLAFGGSGGAMLALRERGEYALMVFYRPDANRVGVYTELEYAAASAGKDEFRRRLREERAP